MTMQLRMALTGVLMMSGTVQAACTIGGHPNGNGAPPMSVTSTELPIIAGGTPANSILITQHGQTPEDREISNHRDEVPQSLNGSTNAPPPPPPPEPGGGNRCDSYRTNVTGTESVQSVDLLTSYLERTPTALGLYRHLLEFNVKQVVDNPGKNTGSHWPVVAWQIPMNDATGPGFVNLRVDYVGLPATLDTLAKRNFSVYWEDTLVARVSVNNTFTPELELKWSADGRMLLLFDVGEDNGADLVQIALASTLIQGFQPSKFQYGRVAMPETIRSSTGTLYAYSHLIESPPAVQ